MWQKNNSLIAKIMLFMSGLLVLSGIILLTLLRFNYQTGKNNFLENFRE